MELLEIIDEFQRFVRPLINPTLTDFCEKHIHSTSGRGQLRNLRRVGQELGAFVAQYPNAAWASWGDYDARQLERDSGLAKCPSLLAGLQHFNVRKWRKGLYDKQPKSLKEAVEAMGLAWQGTYHRVIDDTRNVASIIKEMLG